MQPIPWIITDVNKTKFFVHPRDQVIGRTLIQGQFYQVGKISSIIDLISNDKNIVDIGANLGNHSIIFSRLLSNQNKVVHAFEPQRHVHQQLCANLVMNNIPNVYTYQLALGHKQTTTSLSDTIHVPEGDDVEVSFDRGNTLINYGARTLGNGQEKVEMRTLDSFNLQDIGLIKVDSEGSEQLVLHGSCETILRERPYIWFRNTTYQDQMMEKVISGFSEEDQPSEEIKTFRIGQYCLDELNYAYLIRLADDFLLCPEKLDSVEAALKAQAESEEEKAKAEEVKEEDSKQEEESGVEEQITKVSS